jgi:hypothetical protein
MPPPARHADDWSTSEGPAASIDNSLQGRHTIATSAGWNDREFHVLARTILVSFVLTFIAARITVFLIVSRRIPDIYLHLGGTHVHHLNYGIFLLTGVGAYLLLIRPAGGPLIAAACIYGVGTGLTFDEFGLWLHLGGGYWQRPVLMPSRSLPACLA